MVITPSKKVRENLGNNLPLYGWNAHGNYIGTCHGIIVKGTTIVSPQ